MSSTSGLTGASFSSGMTGQIGDRYANAPVPQEEEGVDLTNIDARVMDFIEYYAAHGKQGDPLMQISPFGAPMLELPALVFSANDMIDLLSSLRSKSMDQLFCTAKEGLESARIKADHNLKQQLEKINEWIDKCKEAAQTGALSKIFGWIGKSLAMAVSTVFLVVAIGATIASGGAAAPLLAVAVIGFVSAAMCLGNAISAEKGGPQISIGSLIQHTVGKFLTEVCSVDPKKAERISNVCGVALMVGLPVMLLLEPSLVGDAAKGILALAGVEESLAEKIGLGFTVVATIGAIVAMVAMSAGTSLPGEASKAAVSGTVKLTGSMMTGTSATLNGGTQIVQGGLGISKAGVERDGQKAIAQRKELEAMMIKLQQIMEEGREDLKKVMEDIEEAGRVVNQMLASSAESMLQITSNVSQKMAV